MVFAHFLADYPLQGDYMSNTKGKLKAYVRLNDAELSDGMTAVWPKRPKVLTWGFGPFDAGWLLTAHAFMHGGCAAIAASLMGAGSYDPLLAGAAIGVTHFAIDVCRIGGLISYKIDQALHVGIAVAVAAALVA